MAEHPLNDDPAQEGELYRLLAENVKDYAIFVLDDEGRVQTWTRGAERLLGYQEHEILGQAADIFFTPEDIQQGMPQREMERARSTGRGEDDRWHMRKDGTCFWSSGVMTPLWDEAGNLRGFAKIMRDRTEWKQADEARHQTEARQAAVLETSLDGIITIDHENRILEFNPAAERLFGYRRSDVLGRKMAEIIIPAHLRSAHYQGMARYLTTGEGPALNQRLRLSALRADGREFPVELAITRVPSEGPPLFTGYIRDVTERELQERRRAAQLAMTEALAEAPSVENAASRILQAMCEKLGWDLGAFWLVDRRSEVLQCLDVWHPPAIQVEGFKRACRERGFARGQGVPGRVWDTGQPLWVPNVTADGNFPRLAFAAEAGLHAAFAVPILLSAEVLGVLEFLSRSVREPDADLLGIMATMGGHVGQFVQQKRNEERLRESEQRFRALMEQAPFSIQVFSPGGRTVGVNGAWEELWGVTLDQIPEYNILQDAQLEAKGVLPYIRRAFAGEAVAVPAIEYDPNETIPDRTRYEDSRRWVSAVAYPLKDESGRVREVILVHEDVTERHRAEDALRESEERYRGIVNRSIAGVAEVDLTGTFLFANERYCEIVGRSLGELLQLRMQDISHPDDLKVNLPLFERMGREGTPYVIEKRYIRPDGSTVWVNNSVSGLRGQDGRVKSVVAVCVDVTSRRQAEENLREADRRKDEFLAMLAHELRNPLAPIRSGLDILALGHTTPEVIDLMRRQVEQLVRLVDDLLDVSRIMRGKVQLRKEPVELAQLVGRAAEAAHPLIDAQHHQFTRSLPPEPVWLDADPVRLAQVISNLLSNAAKYTKQNGHIWLTAEEDGDEVLIRVEDNGIGIDTELLPRIFDLFTQAERSIDRSQGGLGIGLTVCKSLVEMHGGTISAWSAGRGKGSEFTVRLPVLRRAEKPPLSRPRLIASRPRRVLVVDDNLAAARMLSLLLSRIGEHEIRTSHDGPAALEVAQAFQPELVLLDIGLPKMDGYEVARRLRQRPGFADVLLVALTGYGAEEDRRKSVEAGFDEHLVKPPAVEDLHRLFEHPKLTQR